MSGGNLSRSMAPRRKVLLMRLSAMGDVAMTAPIVAAVCEANPNSDFFFLSAPFHEPFFEHLDNFHFLATDIRKDKSGVKGLWRLFRDLKKEGFDVVLDLHNVLRTKVLRHLFELSGCVSFKIDKGRAEKRRLVSGAERRQLRPMTERYADVFRKAGFVVPDAKVVRPAESLPEACPVSQKNDEVWVGVSPFAQHAGKMYPLDRMCCVVRLLLDNPSVRVFLFGGGAQEKAKAAEVVDGLPLALRGRCHNMIGLMRLADEMALMSNLDVMLSMDSSAMHVSSLYGVRVVSIWGGTHPFAGFLGYGQNPEDVVQRDDLDCRPCSIFGNKPCRLGDYRCFDISPEVVVRRVLRS